MRNLLYILLFLSLHVNAQFGASVSICAPPVQSNLVAQFNPALDTFDLSHPSYDKSRVPLSGKSVTFNGTNQDIIGTNASLAPLELNTSFTVSGWVQTSYSGAVQTIFGKYLPTGNQLGVVLNIATDGSIFAQIWTNLSGNVGLNVKFSAVNGTTIPVNNGKPNHICWTYDASGTAAGSKVYLNGLAMTPIVQTTVAPPTTGAFTTNNWRVGSTHSTTGWFKGSIFDARLYFGVAKSATEVASIYAGNLEATGLVFKYNLDENSGTTAYNSYKTAANITANGQAVANGTLQNSPTRSTQNVYSFQNNIGYTLSGSVYIPKNEGVTGFFDAAGNALQYTLPVRHRIRIKHGVKDTINFNPYSAPLSATVSNTIVGTAFSIPPSVPTSYILNSANQVFCWGGSTDPLYVDRTGGADRQFLIYRNFNSFGFGLPDNIGLIKNYVKKPTTNTELVGGQSNGIGSNNFASDLAGLGYSTTDTNCFDWKIGNSTWLQKIANQGTIGVGNCNQVGADISFCDSVQRTLKDKIFCIKYAVSGTFLDSVTGTKYWKPLSLNGHGDTLKLYPLFKANLLNAMSCFNSQYRFMNYVLYWHQGESDCQPANSPNYGANFKLLANSVRTDLNLPNLPIVAVLLSTYQTNGTNSTSLNSIRAQMIDLATNPASANYVPNVTLIDSNNITTYPLTADNLHFNTTAQVRLGKAAATSVLSNKFFK